MAISRRAKSNFMNSSLVKTSLLLIIIAFVCIQCQSTKRARFLRKEYKSIYIDEFKLTYLRQLLNKSYNNSTAIQEIISSDRSGFTEPVLTGSDYKLIDSLTTAENEKLRIDSADGYRRAEGSQGKRPLGYILNRVSSKWLDSLARRRLKISGVPESWTE
jgi:hypothetical protein